MNIESYRSSNAKAHVAYVTSLVYMNVENIRRCGEVIVEPRQDTTGPAFH